jgi:hypothetical protein
MRREKNLTETSSLTEPEDPAERQLSYSSKDGRGLCSRRHFNGGSELLGLWRFGHPAKERIRQCFLFWSDIATQQLADPPTRRNDEASGFATWQSALAVVDVATGQSKAPLHVTTRSRASRAGTAVATRLLWPHPSGGIPRQASDVGQLTSDHQHRRCSRLELPRSSTKKRCIISRRLLLPRCLVTSRLRRLARAP